MKLQVKFPFTMDHESGPKTFMPRDVIESKDLDPVLFASLNSKGFFIELKEKIVETKLPVGAAEVKFENPKDVIHADPLKKVEPKKEEPKKAEVKTVEVKQEVKKEEPKKFETPKPVEIKSEVKQEVKQEVKPVEITQEVKQEVKKEEPKKLETPKIESTPIVEEPARRGRASRNG